MKACIFFISFFCFVSDINSQWTLISEPVGSDYGYRDVFFTNQDTGFITGTVNGEAAIMRTFNGGQNWDTTYIAIETGNLLLTPYSLFFANDTIGYLACLWGIIKTTDCGETWFEIDTGNVYENTMAKPDIVFINADTGFVAYQDGGAGFYVTTDGGLTWTNDIGAYGTRSFNQYNNTYISCWGGYALLDLSTLTWTVFDGNMIDGSGMYFKNAIAHEGRIMVIGEGSFTFPFGLIAWSDDNGVNWQYDYYEVWSLDNIHFRNSTLGYMSGNLPGTLKTTDGGLTWYYTTIDELGTGMSTSFRSFCFVNDTLGYAVSKDGIYKTFNGGGALTGQVEKVTLGTDGNFIAEENVKVYPNPVSGNTLFINLTGDFVERVEVFDLSGKLIIQTDQATSIDVSGITSGSYILICYGELGVYQTEFVVQ